MTGIYIAIIALLVFLAILAIKLLAEIANTNYKLVELRGYIRDMYESLYREIDRAQDMVIDVENKLDILTKPVEEHVANVVTKMFHDIDEED
jgi:hypothetical protein